MTALRALLLASLSLAAAPSRAQRVTLEASLPRLPSSNFSVSGLNASPLSAASLTPAALALPGPSLFAAPALAAAAPVQVVVTPVQAAIAPAVLRVSPADELKGNSLPSRGLGSMLKSLVGIKTSLLPRLENPAMSAAELAEAADFTVERRKVAMIHVPTESGGATPVQRAMMSEVRRVQGAMLTSAARLHARAGGGETEIVSGRSDSMTPRSLYARLGDPATHSALRFTGAAKPATLADKVVNFAVRRGYGFYYDPSSTHFNAVRGFLDTRFSEAVFNTRAILELLSGVLPTTVFHEYIHLGGSHRMDAGRPRALDGLSLQNRTGSHPSTRKPLPGLSEDLDSRVYGAGFSADEIAAFGGEANYALARLKRAPAAARAELESEYREADRTSVALARATKASIDAALASGTDGRFSEGRRASGNFRAERPRVEYSVKLESGEQYALSVDLPWPEQREAGFDPAPYALARLRAASVAAETAIVRSEKRNAALASR